MVKQLDPPIPVEVLGKGSGSCQIIVDHGPEHELLWVVFLDLSRECCTVTSREIRAALPQVKVGG